MITEDDNYIFLNEKDIKKLDKLKCSRYGNNSDIYLYNNDLLKIFNSLGYLFDKDKFLKLKSLNLDNVSKPKKFIILDDLFKGYSMDYKKGDMLLKLDINILLNNIIEALDDMQKSIIIISNNNFEMYDLNCFNILYDKINNKFNIIDLDNYKENKHMSINNLIYQNLIYFQLNLLKSITNNNTYYNQTNKIYTELENIIYFKTYKSNDIKDNFKEIKSILENYSNKEINTIKDIRKVLKKLN